MIMKPITLLLTIFFLSLNLYVRAQATEIGQAFETIVAVDKATKEFLGKNTTFYFLTDVTYPKGYPKLEKYICKHVYGNSGANLQTIVRKYAKMASNDNQTMIAKYNMNWIFCMGYQKGRFFSFLSLICPYNTHTVNWMHNVNTGIINLQNMRPLEIEDIFSKDWLKEHKEIQEAGRLMLLSDWTLIVMNKNKVVDELASVGSSYQGVRSGDVGFWLKSYNLKDCKDYLNPSFLELVDFDSDPISIEPHNQEDKTAQTLSSEVLGKFFLTETE